MRKIKGILWQFYKLGLKVPSGRDKKNSIGHFAELGSSWPGEAQTWPKIVLDWPAGAELGKMTFTIGFVMARRNF